MENDYSVFYVYFFIGWCFNAASIVFVQWIRLELIMRALSNSKKDKKKLDDEITTRKIWQFHFFGLLNHLSMECCFDLIVLTEWINYNHYFDTYYADLYCSAVMDNKHKFWQHLWSSVFHKQYSIKYANLNVIYYNFFFGKIRKQLICVTFLKFLNKWHWAFPRLFN